LYHIQTQGESLGPSPELTFNPKERIFGFTPDITLNPMERDPGPYPDFTFNSKERTSDPFFLSFFSHIVNAFLFQWGLL